MTQLEYLLVCLMEEANEVSQRASKAIRFGLGEVQPGQALTNVERLRGELNDLRANIQMLEELHSLDLSPCPTAIAAKKRKLTTFIGYSEKLGTVELG